jgi:hypothetical protein
MRQYKPKLVEREVERSFWQVHRRIWKARGVDLDQAFASWAEEQGKKLERSGARADFDEFCNDGCTPQILAALMALFRYSPNLEKFWVEMVGHPDRREKAEKALEKAAATLESFFGSFIASEDEQQRAELMEIGRLPISSVVSEIRFYIQFINSIERLAVDTEANSLAEVCKYLITSYVKRSTDSFRDRNVSVLIGYLSGSPDFEEVAQRMWSNRNYKRLNKHFSWTTDFLDAMSVVIGHSA